MAEKQRLNGQAANHAHMVALDTVWYNFARTHDTLPCSPAMAAGLSATLWSMEGIVGLVDARKVPAPKRGPYKPRQPKSA